MDGKREQAFVGLFVLIAVALLLVTIFSLTGFFSRAQPTVPRQVHLRRRPGAGRGGALLGRPEGWTGHCGGYRSQ